MTLFQVILTVAALSASVGYAVFYAVATTWYRTLMGTGQFIDKVSLALLLSLSAATAFFGPDWAGRDFIRSLVFGLLIGGQWAALAAFYVTYRRARRANREESS